MKIASDYFTVCLRPPNSPDLIHAEYLEDLLDKQIFSLKTLLSNLQ